MLEFFLNNVVHAVILDVFKLNETLLFLLADDFTEGIGRLMIPLTNIPRGL